jgi:hypothetical protein
MRLTLRTLLAYLDDILEPAQAKEIGEKLAESSMASNLVSRIREVMRRRRLTAPTLSGPGMGIDPNTVADYLDNTLPPDGVADVEKICLESEIHLAEVAACHQILTLALGEPVEVSAETRERMYALGPAATKVDVSDMIAARNGSGILDGSPSVDSSADSEGAGSAARPRQPVVAVATKPEIPDYLRSSSNSKRYFGYAAVVAVLAIWGFTVFNNSPFKESPSQNEQNNRLDATNLGADNNENRGNQPAVDDQNLMAANVKNHVAVSDDDETADDPKAFQRNDADGVSSALSGDRRGKSANKIAEGGPVPNPPDENTPKIAPVGLSKYVSTDGVTLHYSIRDERWFLMPRAEMVGALALLAVPDPFQCQLEIANGQGFLTILGHSVVGLLAPLPSGQFGIELQRGQFVVRAGSAAPSESPLTLRIAIAGAIWRLELPSHVVCGVSVNPVEAMKLPEEQSRNAYDGAFYVTGGIAAITDPTGQVHEIKGDDWLELPLPIPDDNGNLPPKRELRALPKWMGPQALSSIAQAKAAVFEKKFVRDEPVELSLPRIAEDPNPQLSHMATDCLGLIEAYGPLVSILHSQHFEARRSAISELRLWLPRHADNRELLKAELAKKFPPEDAETVFRLLEGYDLDDARDKLTSTQLVEWMGHPDLAIRELAFYQVYRLTGKSRDYQADGSPAKLNSSLRSWKEHVKKDGGLILPQKPVPNPQ